jgi:hypothetical protein
MSKKFIPNGDFDFAAMARGFSTALAQEPERFEVSREEAEALSAAVEKFNAALPACKYGERSSRATRVKADARAEVERIIRRIANLARVNPRLDAATKMTLGINPRSEKPKAAPVPIEPPRLQFQRAIHEPRATPVHELTFYSADLHSGKPTGAVRLELFVDLIAPDEPIPTHPGANHAARAWYLRSYTRSPIKLVPPIANVPMRVIYWGRWADSMGNVGPFSATAVGWIEGGCGRSLPGGTGMAFGMNAKQIPILEIEQPAEEERPRPQYSVEVLQARYAALNPAAMEQIKALPSQEQVEAAERAA